MKFILIGPGQLGAILVDAAGGARLAIGIEEDAMTEFEDRHFCEISTDIADAAQGDVIAVVVPAGATTEVLAAVADCAQKDAIVLNFATACDIAPELKEKRPDVHWIEAKMVGSAVGMMQGLKSAIVLGTEDRQLYQRICAAMPGLADCFIPGDASVVSMVNTMSTEAALRAAVSVRRSLKEKGVSQEIIDAAIGCGLPGTAISYQRGTLGAFAKKIVHQIEQEL